MDKRTTANLLQKLQPSIGEPSNELLQQLEEVDIATLKRQQELWETRNTPSSTQFSPYNDYRPSGNRTHIKQGWSLIEAGKVGCLLIAGGQGTRLKFSGPKGAFPVSPIHNKTLFQLFAEKVHFAGKRCGRLLPIAIMTSTENHKETFAFFEEHNWFHLNPEQITFFSQGTLPLLNEKGALFLDHPNHLAVGPDGNGLALHHFFEKGIWSAWKEQGVEYVQMVLIDNPLADPFDAEMIGCQQKQRADVVVKCIEKTDPKEKVGVLVKKNTHLAVIEYSELSETEQEARDANGNLKHCCANISLFSFHLDFIKRIAKEKLALHLAHKAVPMLNEKGESITPNTPNAWKFEHFIFDLLPYAEQYAVLLYPRKECFAPIKNASGNNSLQTVQQALIEKDKALYRQLTGKEPPQGVIELSQECTYLSIEEVVKGLNSLNKHYIDRKE